MDTSARFFSWIKLYQGFGLIKFSLFIDLLFLESTFLYIKVCPTLKKWDRNILKPFEMFHDLTRFWFKCRSNFCLSSSNMAGSAASSMQCTATSQQAQTMINYKCQGHYNLYRIFG